ncbi:MAG TPA: 50S ribosomal protein L11 methyltransferase [Candidatus Nanoarchaeia archaeon]|nr:50S ribosomal protein L11 methyltransferase [Candidatus Nanoarchaeia archaeon]
MNPENQFPHEAIEKDARLRHYPLSEQPCVLLGPDGKEAAYSYGLDSKKFIRYMRVGEWWLLDSSFFLKGSDPIQKLDEQKIIWVSNHSPNRKPLHWSHHPYTANILHALTHVDFKGKVVLDLGCGNGLLGVLALKLGAIIAIGIDNDQRWEGEFLEHANLNGVSDRAQFLYSDLSKPDEWASSLGNYPIDIILANIGPHYGQTDMLSISLLGRFPSVKAFIGGGYIQAPNGSAHTLSPCRAYVALNKQGFAITGEIQEIMHTTDGTKKKNRLSFIAIRSNEN